MKEGYEGRGRSDSEIGYLLIVVGGESSRGKEVRVDKLRVDCVGFVR